MTLLIYTVGSHSRKHQFSLLITHSCKHKVSLLDTRRSWH